MPTYEYECKTCSHNFEVFQSMSDPPLKECPVCGKEVRRLIFGGSGVIFKGSGFYVTDKGKSGAGGGKTSAKDASKEASKGSSSQAGNAASGATETAAGGASAGSSVGNQKEKSQTKTA